MRDPGAGAGRRAFYSPGDLLVRFPSADLGGTIGRVSRARVWQDLCCDLHELENWCLERVCGGHGVLMPLYVPRESISATRCGGHLHPVHRTRCIGPGFLARGQVPKPRCLVSREQHRSAGNEPGTRRPFTSAPGAPRIYLSARAHGGPYSVLRTRAVAQLPVAQHASIPMTERPSPDATYVEYRDNLPVVTQHIPRDGPRLHGADLYH